MSRIKSYVICTSPRSGSTLLCRLLQQAGTAGVPNSHFHVPSLEAWLGSYGLGEVNFQSSSEALGSVMAAALARGRGMSDVFGLRLQHKSAGYLLEQLRMLHPTQTCDVARIEAAFGRTLFIHLTRENKLDQAISHVRAEQSGLWHRAADGSELERVSEHRDPTYDAEAIAAHMEAAERMDRAWEAWFAAETIAPLRVSYDVLSADPFATRDRILTALGVVCDDAEEQTPPTAKLADAMNLAWAERFRRDRLA